MVGTRTRRSLSGSPAIFSTKATPASPVASVSAMICAWQMGTRSSASKKAAMASWCLMAHWRAEPSSPTSIACSSSFSFMRADLAAVASIRLRAGSLHRLIPLDNLLLLKGRKFVASATYRKNAEGAELMTHRVGAGDSSDFAVELLSNIRRQVGRAENCPPCCRLKPGKARLREGRHLGQHGNTRRTAHTEDLEVAREHL